MFITAIIRKINQWTKYRRNLRELAVLSDRELDDIGIKRLDIDSLAWKAARG